MPECEACPRVLIERDWTWDWFTGYLDRTVYFCPDHKGGPESKRLRQQSLIRPDDWPEIYWRGHPRPRPRA